MNSRQRLAVIGSGASAIYLLKHLLDEVETIGRHFGSIAIFEKGDITGMGMPYNPRMTDRHNMSNISSEELPELPVTLGDWLREQDAALLAELGVDDQEISDSEVYSRLALGRYLQAQYQTILAGLADSGIAVREFPRWQIVEIRCGSAEGEVVLESAQGEVQSCDRVVIATGHSWKKEDHPDRGYFASPWPISKLIPAEGEYLDFTIGTLGASLSAFDVISSLAHRHGEFSGKAGTLKFHPSPGTENFKVVMHSAEGLLPHLQYDQVEPLREIYRHVDRDSLLALVDADGFLRLDTYFDQVCRPALSAAFTKDGMTEMVGLLENPDFGFAEFVEKMTDKHEYPDAFAGMRHEMGEASRSVRDHRPIHWKEVIDDLIYTLNFHAERMPAEDHLQLRSCVLPFLMNVVAAMPLGSAHILLALHAAGKLELVTGEVEVEEDPGQAGRTTILVSNEDKTQRISYRMFVDCSGQKPLELDEYPFQGLVHAGLVRRARARFSDPGQVPEEKRDLVFEEGGHLYYATGGIDIDAACRLINAEGIPDPRLFDIAFPHTSGVRPYSYGLQACSETARLVVDAIVAGFEAGSASR